MSAGAHSLLQVLEPEQVDALADRARAGVRAARRLRRRDWASDGGVGRARAPRRRPRRTARSTVQRKFADGRLTPYPKTSRSPATCAADRRAHSRRSRRCRRGSTRRSSFPRPRAAYIGLDTWRTREWYPALEAAGIAQRGPYSPAAHVRDRGARRRHLDLRARAADGDVDRDDRPHLRAPGPRLRGVDAGASRRESPTFWR